MGLKILKALGPAARYLVTTVNLPFKGGLVQRNGELAIVVDRMADVRAATRAAAARRDDVLRDVRTYSLVDFAGEIAGAGSSVIGGQREILPLLKDAARGLIPFYGTKLATDDFRSRCFDKQGENCPAEVVHWTTSSVNNRHEGRLE